MAYRFDPELVPWIPMIGEVESDLSDIVAARVKVAELFASVETAPFPEGVTTRDVTVPGDPGVRVRVYTPRDATGGGVLYIHGGGFIIGNIEMGDGDAAAIADEIGAVVVSVDYRLAPENPFPAGLEDCYTALVWTAEHAAELGIDPARIAVAGESAGGGLSAALALLARDRGGPALCFQVLNIPELDDRLDTPSMRQFTDTPMWRTDRAEISWKYYLCGDSTVDGEDGRHYAAPARAEDLSGLPPAFVSTCEFDPLRDEGLSYAQRLLQAGVSTELHHYPGTFHGSSLVREAGVTKRMTSDLRGALKRALGGTP
ncbi:alpha/beta hydrolase [Amycolatopsis sp. CA-230715]|uniref:alpha/beta hydrolase n=1 Tax=Amycolatopsis sp. CA-230715 TaxID=2745196 RepID=UPI001C017601|nr:alpha/beta hydrolase [Amycolatopsis sp. CA-230715]QWF81287.1 Carboxylesterase NlhH [Amycolatopsis sp. CA-230715]